MTVSPLQILIADRHRAVAQSLARVLTTLTGAEVAGTVHSADEALEASGKMFPDVAFVDLDLSSGRNIIAELHALTPDTRIIAMVDRNGSTAGHLVDALTSGAVGAIYAEASMHELERALRSSSRASPVVADEAAGVLLGAYVDALNEKRERDLAIIEALAAAVEARDFGTGKHQRRVTDLAKACMEAIDSDLAHNDEISYGFLLHDVGKIGVADSILNKPGPLGAHEWQAMQRHPEMGVRIVEPIGFSEATTDIILRHHEHWNGGGYPDGLAGEEIPITARAFAVADAYDAMTSDRPYRPAMRSEQALRVIEGEAGKRYDSEVVDVFLQSVAG